MTRVRRWFAALSTIAALVVGSLPATAAELDAPTVALVVPASPDPLIAEVLVRVEGELRAAGFDVSVVRQENEESPEDALDHAATRRAPVALVGVFGSSPTGIDLWVVDRLKQRTIRRAVRNADLGSRNSEVLAVRTAEQLSASLEELDIAPAPKPAANEPKPPAAPAETRPPPAAPSLPQRPLVLGLEVGPAAVFSFQGVGPAILPLVRLGVSPFRALEIRLTGAAFGTRPRITSELGTARFAQSFVLVDVTYGLEGSSGFRPYATLGGGAYHAEVFGSSAVDLPSKNSSLWAAALELGAGCSYRLAHGVQLVAELDALLMSPYVVVRFADQERAKTGQPAMLLSASARGWL